MKNKLALFFIITSIVAFIIYSVFSLINLYQSLYYYVINPLFWILLSMITYVLFYQQVDRHFKYKKIIIEITLIAALIYILLFWGLGIISGFGNNPYDTSIAGIFLNIWSIGFVIASKEYIRYFILNVVSKKHVLIMGILITILYFLLEINILNLNVYFSDETATFKFITTVLLPFIMINILYNYLVLKSGYLPSMIYALLTNIILWLFSILPNHGVVVLFILNTLIPFFILLIIDYYITKKERTVSEELLEETNPKRWIPNFIFVIFITSFVLGTFNYKPIVIITNSMHPNINRGDIIVIKKMDIAGIKINDVVSYKKGSYTVIHRVIDKYENNNQLILITKGDNNKVRDVDPVLEYQVVGKVIIIIPKIGYPSIWLKKAFNIIS
jgi:signal peptidase